jgi:two-component system cell cycle sensor histidine kinase/response regulator CckA
MNIDDEALHRAAILERIASGAPIAGTLDEIVVHVEAMLPGAIGSILLLERSLPRLRCSSVRRLPTAYNDAIDGTVIGPNVGSCGSAAFLGEPVYVSDVTKDRRWDAYRELALQHGLRACWSVPIQSRRRPRRQRVLGTFAVYFRTAQAIDAESEAILLQAEKLASIALEADAALAEIREEEGRFRMFVDYALDGLFLHDPRTGAIVEVNRTACDALGYTRDELVGMRPHEFDPDLTPEVLSDIIARLDAGEDVTFESRHKRKDGVCVPVEVRCRSVVTGGTPYNIALVRDISERRRLEDQLLHARRMEAIGRLAGGIAHDFNNLLTIVEVSTEMILTRVPIDSPLRADLLATRDAGARAAALTAQLLAFSRQSIVEPKSLDLNAIVARMATMLDRVIGENIVLSTQLAQGLPHVLADAGQVEQVLMNLVVNARDAMPRGGTLRIETALLERATEDLGALPRKLPPTVALTVRDSGIGMTDEVRARLFEPYFTTKGPGRGSGLGLATVYGIMTQSDGEVRVESAPGRGSSITAVFAASNAPKAVIPLEPAPAAGGAEVILLVEDEDDVRRLVARALATSGYEVLTARSAEEALAIESARDGAVDLLVTDVIMPKLGGRELVDALRTRRPDVRVLFISGYTDDEIVRQGVSGARDAFLQKPFTPSALARKVREVLDAASP